MRILLAIPHVFAPKEGSLYSSQSESKRELKGQALFTGTIGNLIRHGQQAWIHSSLGNNRPVVTRSLKAHGGHELFIQIYSPKSASLTAKLPKSERIEIIDVNCENYLEIPMIASRRLIEQSPDYDMIGYLEDDLLIEDPDFFDKVVYLDQKTLSNYVFLPHRCESIPMRGDVILSGDPDGGRPDLYWDTGEQIKVPWPTGEKTFYRATNPHSGCYFLPRRLSTSLLQFWERRSWNADFQLSGPLEQAGSGLLLPLFHIMKPLPAQYRFLMVRHQDSLWKRHPFENL